MQWTHVRIAGVRAHACVRGIGEGQGWRRGCGPLPVPMAPAEKDNSSMSDASKDGKLLAYHIVSLYLLLNICIVSFT